MLTFKDIRIGAKFHPIKADGTVQKHLTYTKMSLVNLLTSGEVNAVMRRKNHNTYAKFAPDAQIDLMPL